MITEMNINLKQLIADREAGTDGPWHVAGDPCHYDSKTDVVNNRGHLIAGMAGSGVSEMEANAARIARLPDLEAAFLEAVNLLQRISESDKRRLRYFWRN